MEIVATGFGGPDRLTARKTRTAAPGKGEVAVRIMAAAVNPVDRKLYADPDYTRSHGEAAPEFPLRLGVEAAGVVTAVGEAANGPAGPILVGDDVIAYRIRGAYADRIVAPARGIHPSRWTLIVLTHEVFADAQNPSSLRAGVPATDRRLGSRRS